MIVAPAPYRATGANPQQNAVAAAALTCLSYRALEQRIAFDAAMAATVDEAVGGLDGAPQAGASMPEPSLDAASVSAIADAIPAAGNGHTWSEPPRMAAEAAVVVFIDGAVRNGAVIASATPDDAEIVVLAADRDGLQQIADYLDGRTGIGAIHIVSHGEAGALWLGSTVVNVDTLTGRHSGALAAVAASLSDGADILVYGCSVGDGVSGRAFIDAISAATGADVAASSDDTGHVDQGGDWSLEVSTGSIEASALDVDDWSGILAPLTISTSAAPTLSGATGVNAGTGLEAGGVGFSGLWENAGTVGSTAIDVRATVVGLTSGSVSFFTQGDDPSIVINDGGTATIKWEIFVAGTSQTVAALASPNFQIADIDGVGGVPETREGVRPQIEGLTSYTVDNPTNLAVTVSAGGVLVSGSENQNGEPTSLVAFTWHDVSSWTVEYIFDGSSGFSSAVFRHDGDGDLGFTAPSTTNLLSLDLDGRDTTAAGSGYHATYIENGSPVAIAGDDLAIAQSPILGSELHMATVRLLDAQPGDELLVDGANAAAGTFSAGGATFSYAIAASGSEIDIAITGAATSAQYQAALQAITFRNGSENPSEADRHIAVTVTSATFGTASNQALSTVNVLAIDDAPVVVDPASPGSPGSPNPAHDPLHVIPDVSTSDGATAPAINVGAVFVDPEGRPLTFSASGLPPGLAIDPLSGIISGTLTADASRWGSFTALVTATDPAGATAETTITYVVANAAPVAVDDAAASRLGAAVTLDVLANDYDRAPDSDPLRVVSALAANGTVRINADGTLTYVPHYGFAGLETVRYRISDGNGGFATATIRIAVTPDAFIQTVDDRVVVASGLRLLEVGQPPAFEVLPQGGQDVSTVPSAADDALLAPRAGDAVATSGTFSMVLSNSEALGTVALETQMSGSALVVRLSHAASDDEPNAVEWHVQRVDGRPLPAWLVEVGDGVIAGERPAEVEWIDLRITCVLPDGSTVVNDVRIMTKTGEVQLLRLGRSGALAPPMLWDQIEVRPAMTAHQIAALARMLQAAH